MPLKITSLAAMLLMCSNACAVGATDNIKLSRDSCVAVISEAGKSKGTGFMISKKHVVTCFHVVASLKPEPPNTVRWTFSPDLKVITADGEEIPARCISAPTPQDPAPLQFDFAILELAREPNSKLPFLDIANGLLLPEVGVEVLFSGYPLQTPAMVTHKGMVSGISSDGSIICIQAPVNKGNSGGALIGLDGRVQGILSMREGGIGRGLDELRVYIDTTSKSGSVQLMGVDPLLAINALIGTLDIYISTGIGYARSSKFLSEYLARHPLNIK
jgi:S1-C subfamily serine protease